jgi:CRP-like cAMP-binding protein
LQQLVNGFTLRTVKEKEDVITQGEDGDYFYVIDKGNTQTHSLTYSLTHLLTHSFVVGSFAVIVDGKQVSTLSETSTKSFGELALMHNAKRAATVRSLCTSLTHSLTHSLTYLLTHSLTYLRTYSLTHLLTYVLTHSLTDSQLFRHFHFIRIGP